MAAGLVTQHEIIRVHGTAAERARDELVAEEPLELRLAGHPVGVTMRTPGNDFELAIGYCITEGLVPGPEAVHTVRYCAPPGDPQEFNVLSVELRPGVPTPDRSLDRVAVTSSSCGVCGKSSIDAVRVRCASLADDPVVLDSAVLATLPDRLRAAQRVFDRTGGLHAAALCAPDGEVRCVREDVGRHNAVDKIVGWAATNGRLPLRGQVLLVSGRASFEIVQKAAVAGIPVVAAVSAPSNLAVALAEELGVTVIGFLRGSSMNVYTRPDRVRLPHPAPVG